MSIPHRTGRSRPPPNIASHYQSNNEMNNRSGNQPNNVSIPSNNPSMQSNNASLYNTKRQDIYSAYQNEATESPINQTISPSYSQSHTSTSNSKTYYVNTATTPNHVNQQINQPIKHPSKLSVSQSVTPSISSASTPSNGTINEFSFARQRPTINQSVNQINHQLNQQSNIQSVNQSVHNSDLDPLVDFDDDDKYHKTRKSHRTINQTINLSFSRLTSLSTPVLSVIVLVVCLIMMSLSVFWFSSNSHFIPTLPQLLGETSIFSRASQPSVNIIVSNVVDDETRFSDPETRIRIQSNNQANIQAINHFTDNDVTIFTVYSREPFNEPIKNKRGKIVKSFAHDNTSSLHAIYSWNKMMTQSNKQSNKQSNNQPMQSLKQPRIVILVKEIDHCTDLIDRLSFEPVCRVASTCWSINNPSNNQKTDLPAPKLKCILNEAALKSSTKLSIFVEDHIVLFKDFIPALLTVSNQIDDFFLVGSSRALSLTVDAELSLSEWQQDLEAALFYDSSVADGDNDHEKHKDVDHQHALHYFAYRKDKLNVDGLSDDLLMGGGAFYGHHWEKILVAHILVQDELTLVDVTDAVTAVELTHSDPSNMTIDINVINESINSTITPSINLGRLENSHYVLIGACPTCSLKENREADLPLILLRAQTNNQVIVMTVNSDYLSLAFNWICRARVLNITNYVLLAEDRVAYRLLRKMDVPVVLRRDAPYAKLAAITGSAEFQETLYLRALFFKDVISLGFDLILTHLDTIWFSNPQQFLASHTECDMFVQMEGGSKAGGGLLFIRGTVLGQQFVKDYLICEQENWEFITVHGKSRFFYSDDPDMNCVDLISQRLVRRNHLKRCVLDPMLYVSEGTFFDTQMPQHKALYPSFVHLNSAEGVRNKTRAFLDWDLWAVDDLQMVSISALKASASHAAIACKPLPAALPSPEFDDAKRIRIVVNVLASTEHFALSQTLEHLAAAAYSPEVKVDVRLYIQQPEHESSSTNKQYMRVVNLAKEFRWLHGLKSIIYLSDHVGPTDQWINHWVLEDPDTGEDSNVFQLALLAGQSLSREWASWTRKALQNYYYHPYQHDSQLMGIHLMHQFTIVGESPAARFGSRVPSTVLNQSTSLYHYQLVPLLGTLFFPQHFETFLLWYSAQNTTAGSSVACIPTLLSNQWYRNEPLKHWWVWFTRFTFESGWYALYTNFLGLSDHKPRALLIDETPLAGQLTVSLVRTLATREANMPASSMIRLYDLHFNEFQEERRHLQLRKTLFPPIPSIKKPELQDLDELQARAEEIDRERQRLRSATQSSEVEEDADTIGLWTRVINKRQAREIATMIADIQVDESEQTQHNAEDEATEEEEFVTTTDLVIDLMKQVQSESESDNDQSNGFDTTRYADQLNRITSKINHVRAGAQHMHHHVRGSNLDRCFVIGDPLPDEPSVTAVVDVLSTLPAPYNLSMSLEELYLHIYTTNFARLPVKPKDPCPDPAKFIIYRPTGVPVPFDRHLRGIYFTFLTAVMTERIFLVDFPDFELMYNVPWKGVKWSVKAFSKYFVNGSCLTTTELDDTKLKSSLRTQSFNSIFPQSVVYHTNAISHDRLMFTNVAYKPFALALFGTLSRMRRVGVLMKLVLSKPANALIASNKALFKDVGLSSVKYSLCVHVVAPPSALAKLGSTADPLPGVTTQHWNCVKSQLLALGFKDVDSVILFTTNSPYASSLQVAESEMGKFGRVVTNLAGFDTNQTNYGICNSTLVTNDRKDVLTQAVLYDPYVTNHFAFGDCDVSISSGTTYGIFGAARTGFSKRAYLFKPKPAPTKDKQGNLVESDEQEYCGPMHRIDYPKDNDIHF